MKGQLGPENLIQIFLAVILFIFVVYPIEVPMINDYILVLQASPQPYTTFLITLIQLWPIAEGIGILALIWFFAIPHQERQGY